MKRIMALSGALLLAGCATPYQRTGATGGFSETRLQENVFTVNFRGNGHCGRERAQDFAMLRCAEVTLDNGFLFFTIADSSADEKTLLYHSGSSSQTSGTMSSFGSANTYGRTTSFGSTTYGNFNTYNSPSYTVPIRKPRISYTIFCLKEKPPEGQMAFDAQYLSNSIRQKYGLATAKDEGK